MTIKQKAFIQTVLTMSAIVAISFLAAFATTLMTKEIFIATVTTGMFVFFGWLLYSFILSDLETQERLKTRFDKSQETK